MALAVGNMVDERRKPYAELFLEDKEGWIGEVVGEEDK